MKELRSKIWEALLSALPITVIVYLMALTPWFQLNRAELITFSVGAVLLILGIGLVSLCSIGPVLAVMVLGMFSGKDLTYQVPDYAVSADVLGSLLHTLGHTAKEVALALGLIVVFFLICQLQLSLVLPFMRKRKY